MPVARRVVRHQFSVPAPPPAAWSPLSLPSLITWLDASDTASITSSANDVSQWNDKSGNVRHATQGTAIFQFRTNTDTLNGLNVMLCNRAQSSMTATIPDTAQPLTVLCVFKQSSTANPARVIDSSSRVLLNPSSAHYGYYAGTAQEGAGAPDTSAHQQVAVFNGASSACYIDGSSITTANPGANATGTTLWIGNDPSSGGTFQGDIAEIVVMGAAISSGDRASWNTYCARWGL